MKPDSFARTFDEKKKNCTLVCSSERKKGFFFLNRREIKIDIPRFDNPLMSRLIIARFLRDDRFYRTGIFFRIGAT